MKKMVKYSVVGSFALLMACSSNDDATTPVQALSLEELGGCNSSNEGTVKQSAVDGLYYSCNAGNWNVYGMENAESSNSNVDNSENFCLLNCCTCNDVSMLSSSSEPPSDFYETSSESNENEEASFVSSSSSAIAVVPSSSSSILNEKGTLKDTRDGRNYKTVTIGAQIWMAENLNYDNGVAESYCYDEDENLCNDYGRLYTWKAAMEACPDGWHLPNYDEWNELVVLVRASAVDVAAKLKSTSGWISNDYGESRNGKDLYGFSAFPAGERLDGEFMFLGELATFWSSTNIGGYAYCMYISYDLNGTNLSYDNDEIAMSVRCVKD